MHNFDQGPSLAQIRANRARVQGGEGTIGLPFEAPPMKPGIDNAGDRSGAATDQIGLLQQILEELRAGRGQNEALPVQAPLIGQTDHFIADIALDSALTKEPYKFPNSYRLTFLNVPECLCLFHVRINEPNAPVIDMLCAGNQIRTSNPINRVYITTEPALPGATLKVVAGEMDVVQTSRQLLPNDRVYDLKTNLGNDSAVSVDSTDTCPKLYTTTQKTISATSELLFDSIPERWSLRVWGTVTARINSDATDLGEIKIRALSSAFAQRGTFGHWFVPETGSLIFPFDSGWFCFGEDDGNIKITVQALGPATQTYLTYASLWTIPA